MSKVNFLVVLSAACLFVAAANAQSQEGQTIEQIQKEMEASRAADQAMKANDLRRVHPPGDPVRPDSKGSADMGNTSQPKPPNDPPQIKRP